MYNMVLLIRHFCVVLFSEHFVQSLRRHLNNHKSSKTPQLLSSFTIRPVLLLFFRHRKIISLKNPATTLQCYGTILLNQVGFPNYCLRHNAQLFGWVPCYQNECITSKIFTYGRPNTKVSLRYAILNKMVLSASIYFVKLWPRNF